MVDFYLQGQSSEDDDNHVLILIAVLLHLGVC